MSALPVLPELTCQEVLAFQCSSWYPKFAKITFKCIIIRPLDKAFIEYLNADGVTVPQGSENQPVDTSLSEGEASDSDDDVGRPTKTFAFPTLDTRIRQAVAQYGAVFPKLNFTAPQDANWVLSDSAPLKCFSPADVYLALKASDVVNHDLDCSRVFEGCSDFPHSNSVYELELVLKKWYPVERSREFRCFVRNTSLFAISQRDLNYYDFLNDEISSLRIKTAIASFWKAHLDGQWDSRNYVFDVVMTRDLMNCHIEDFNPYGLKTDPILFSYEELRDIMVSSIDGLPVLRVVDSRTHPLVNQNTPSHFHNRIPYEVLHLSNGRDLEEFSAEWIAQLTESI